MKNTYSYNLYIIKINIYIQFFVSYNRYIYILILYMRSPKHTKNQQYIYKKHTQYQFAYLSIISVNSSSDISPSPFASVSPIISIHNLLSL